MSSAVACIDAIRARFEGHPFVDYFDCLTASLEAAKRRSKRAVQATREGNIAEAAMHRQLRDDYMQRVRQWHDMIDWSVAND